MAATRKGASSRSTRPQASEGSRTVDLPFAEAVLRILSHRWLDGMLSSEANRVLPGVLLAAFVAEIRGQAPSRAALATLLHIDAARTAARYVALGEEMGLLEVHPDPDDRRRHIVRLTESGRAQIERDLEALAFRSQRLSHPEAIGAGPRRSKRRRL